MPALFKCDLCGRGTERVNPTDTGQKVCNNCNTLLQRTEYISTAVPEAIVWAGRVAKMGKDADGSQRTVIVIPKSQRLFFDNNAKYSFVARKIK